MGNQAPPRPRAITVRQGPLGTFSGRGRGWDFPDKQFKSPTALDRGLVLEPDMCADRCLHKAPKCDGQWGTYSCCLSPVCDFSQDALLQKAGLSAAWSPTLFTQQESRWILVLREGTKNPGSFKEEPFMTRHQNHQCPLSFLSVLPHLLSANYPPAKAKCSGLSTSAVQAKLTEGCHFLHWICPSPHPFLLDWLLLKWPGTISMDRAVRAIQATPTHHGNLWKEEPKN